MKNIILILFLLFPSICLGASQTFPPSTTPPEVADFLAAPGHTYYCATDGDNGTGDGSIETPWYDLRGAEGNIVAGDLIYFRGGTYSNAPATWAYSDNQITVDGTSGNVIVISNYPGEQVIYNDTDGWCMTLDGDYQKLIGTKNGTDYGIKITGGISVRGSYCQISGVEFIKGADNGGDANPGMISNPVNGDSITNTTYSHCYFHDSEDVASVNRQSCIRFFVNTNSIVEYNLFENNLELTDGACIYFKDATTDAVVRYNTFVNCLKGIEYFTQGDHHDGLHIYKNLFYDVDYPFRFRNEWGPDILVYQNVCLSIPGGGAFYYYLGADLVGDGEDYGSYYDNVIDGTGFEAGWHTNSADGTYIPTLFDYNLWYDANDQNEPGNWDTSGYHANAVVSNNCVTYNPSTYTCYVDDDYAGKTSGKDGGVIGGFEFSTACTLTGTITNNVTESDITDGGETIILTLTGDTWHADIGTDCQQTTDLIAGIDSDKAEAAGWDAEVKAKLDFNNVVRDSDTQVTITLDAADHASYDITESETITVTVPASCLVTGSEAVTASPTFTVGYEAGGVETFGCAWNASGPGGSYHSNGLTVTAP